MKHAIAVLTAAGLINLSWDAAAKALNAEHEDQSDPGFGIILASTTALTTTGIRTDIKAPPETSSIVSIEHYRGGSSNRVSSLLGSSLASEPSVTCGTVLYLKPVSRHPGDIADILARHSKPKVAAWRPLVVQIG
jgi:hypothetical protein